jgi:hypothetical protein
MEEEVGGKPVLAVLRSTSPNEVSAPRGFCFGDRWFCSVECLEWGMGQEILQLFRKSQEKAMRAKPRIGTMLLIKGWITPEQLREALEAQRQHGSKLGHWLVKLEYITEEKLIRVLSEQLRLPWMDEIKQPFSRDVLSVLPKMLCKRFNVFPLEFQKESRLVLAVDYGFSSELTEAIDEVVGCKVRPFLTRTNVLKELVNEHLNPQADNTSDVIPERISFANQVGQKFVKGWLDFEAERARFRLFEDNLWVRYLKGEDVKDHFILFGSDSGVAAPEHNPHSPDSDDTKAQAGTGR